MNPHNVGSTQALDHIVRWDNSTPSATRDKVSSEAWVRGLNITGVVYFAGNNLDQSKKASDFNGSYVYSVSVWEVETGKDMQLIQAFMESKSILEDMRG